MLIGPSSGYVLDFFPLSFVIKATCTSNYFVITRSHQAIWWMVEVDVDVPKNRVYTASS